jgi:hypothetical protein
VKIVCENIPVLEPVSILLGSQPPPHRPVAAKREEED